MLNSRLSTRVLACTLLAPALSVAAQDQPVDTTIVDPYGGNRSPQVAESYDAPGAINTGQFSFSAGAELVSIYIFRGAEVQDDGFILQPWAEISTAIGDTGFDLTAGIWNSLGTNRDGAQNVGLRGVLETDLYVGTSYELDQFTLSATLTGYYSPGGYFEDIEEIAFGAEYDDSAYLEDWAVNPYALIAFEIRDAGGSEDVYLELGGALGAPFVDSETMPVELSFPFAIGFSLDDYNGADGFDWLFLKAGAEASIALDQIPAEFGSWTAHAALDLYIVNDDDNLAGLDNGDSFTPVLRVGATLEY